MADYCKQCSIQYFGEDHKDLAGLISTTRVNLRLCKHVLCEGCGSTFVDNDGVCVGPDCLYKHGEEQKDAVE